jgi:hypothetical protein
VPVLSIVSGYASLDVKVDVYVLPQLSIARP